MKKYWQIKPWMFIVLSLVVIAILLFAFGYKGSSGLYSKNYDESVSAGSMDMFAAEPSAAPAMMEDVKEVATQRMIIKTGSLSMVVDDVRKSVQEITSYVEGKGGFLVASNINKYDLDLVGDLTVRVPSALLEDTVAYVKGMGDVEGEHIDGRDITEEYVDLESQLGNLQATEKQFLEIMKSAVKIEDVLAVQRELSSVRQNIESIKGRMKYLNESVDLSSLTIYLSTNPSSLPVVDNADQWKPFAVFKDAIRSLLGTGQGVLNGLIWFGVYLPIVIVVLLAAWGIKRFISRKKRKQ